MSPALASPFDDRSLACTGFLALAFVLAGLVHVAWMRSPASKRFARPIDAGRRFRGRRLFGDHKTWRGFLALPPAAALSFALLPSSVPALCDRLPPSWPDSPFELAALGLLGGLGFMVGELPNSFLKRRLEIAPGRTGRTRRSRFVLGVLDHTDSILGLLLTLCLVVTVPAWSFVHLLIAGPLIHLGFSALLFALGVKARAA